MLNRLWLEPRAGLIEFVDRGMSLYKSEEKVSISALCWGVAIAAYPFFG